VAISNQILVAIARVADQARRALAHVRLAAASSTSHITLHQTEIQVR
jgi:hypothetical protein